MSLCLWGVGDTFQNEQIISYTDLIKWKRIHGIIWYTIFSYTATSLVSHVHTHMHTVLYTHIHIYIHVYIYTLLLRTHMLLCIPLLIDSLPHFYRYNSHTYTSHTIYIHMHTNAKWDVTAETLIQNCLVISQNYQVTNATKAQATKVMQTSLCVTPSKLPCWKTRK